MVEIKNKKKIDIKVSLLGAHEMSRGQLQGMTAPVIESEVEEKTKPARLINKMNHPIQLSYDGKGLMLSPREKTVIANIDRLGSLPRGVMAVLLNN